MRTWAGTGRVRRIPSHPPGPARLTTFIGVYCLVASLWPCWLTQSHNNHTWSKAIQTPHP